MGYLGIMDTQESQLDENQINENQINENQINENQEEQNVVENDLLAYSEDEVDSSGGSYRQGFDKFMNDLKLITNVEQKLQFVIDFMEKSIAQAGTPHFKSFWEARRVCLELFKENIAPALRSILWNKYNELFREARRLKDILDEQSAFAVEQIEIAVEALENDISNNEQRVQQMSPMELGGLQHILEDHISQYQQMQLSLNFLNIQASRINALRKELLRTEMRVRQKNKFFQRLSSAGDQVFPPRKELIKQISDLFANDIDLYIERNFKSEGDRQTLSALREGIKLLQGMAKVLTLNTHAFTRTRLRLSECWDSLKGEEKERKKEWIQQRAVLKQNLIQAREKLNAFKEAYLNQTLTFAELKKQIDEMGVEFRNLELERDDRMKLREEFIAARQPMIDQVQSEENARTEKQNEREQLRRQRIIDLKQQIESLVKNSENFDAEVLSAKRDELILRLNDLGLAKLEKLELERQLKVLRDIIIEKREVSLLSLSEDDRNSLQGLKSVLEQRKERRQLIKTQIDLYRKSNGDSGLDFEQAMNYNAFMATEKDRLEKINQGINEIEEKIAELENNCS